MRIGVLSDIHDALPALERALSFFGKEEISTLLFLGDFCSPIPCRVLKAFPGEIHAVFGNGDGDRWQMMNIAAIGPKNLFLHGEYADLTFDDRRVGITHYPFYAEYMALSGRFDAVFNGHTHERAYTEIGKTLWANPGDIMGWKNPPSAGIWDTNSNTWEFVSL